jgi:hypothetical protein
VGVVLARPIVLIPHLSRLAGVFNFRKDYSPLLVRHLDPTHAEGPKLKVWPGVKALPIEKISLEKHMPPLGRGW